MMNEAATMHKGANGNDVRPSVSRQRVAHLESFNSYVVRVLQRAGRESDARLFAAEAQQIMQETEDRIIETAQRFIRVRD